MSHTLEKYRIEIADQPKITEQLKTSNRSITNVNPEKLKSQAELKTVKNLCAEIKEYSSFLQISEKIDEEITATNVILGEYLRQLDYIRHLAIEASGKKREQTCVNGFEIILDATPTNELAAMESVVRSYSERLTTLKTIKESLNRFCELQAVEGIIYLVLEKEGIPKRIIVRKLKT